MVSRAARVWLVVAVVLVGGSPSSSADPAAPAAIRGRATVVDGDGLRISGREIRLFGIDAPEVGQYCDRDDGSRWRCGHYASVALDKATVGKTVECVGHETDAYGRVIAVCRAEGRDLGAMQVRDGWAVAYRRYSEDYVDVEKVAKRNRVGVWQGEFEMPWRWRERMRRR